MVLVLSAALLITSIHSLSLAASGEDLQTLGMYYEANDLVVSATRNPKPLSQAAENITIITAKEIEMMGAHTLVDVLANVPGIQSSDRGGPGGFNEFSIQGANVNHILVLLDGVSLNFVGSPVIDISGFPLQNIERLEIIKGPGSSSWGSALGAVINIVTKSPLEGRKVGGALSFSGGERGTRDSRGELSGTVGPLGYYFYAGNLRSDGFRPNSGADQNDLYAKLRWDLPEKGSLQFSIAYDRGIFGTGDLITTWPFDLTRFRRRYFLSTLSFNYPVTDKIDLDLSLRTSYKKAHEFSIIGGSFDQRARETSDGGSVKLTWREKMNTLAAGVDYDHLDIDWRPWFQSFSDRYGVFLTDTLSLGNVSITPSFRYDQMRPVGDFFSPSIGVAWNPTDKITLRAYGARGYSLPLLCPAQNSNATQAKVTTVQAGVETTYIPWLWLKGTFFWNQLSDVQEQDPVTWEYVLKKQLKQGAEVEGKTVPILNTSLSAGYTFIDTKDRDTGETLRDVPRQLVKLGVHYDDDQHSFRGSLLGRYGWLNSSEPHGKYSAIIWDLNLAKKVFTRQDTAVELFFNAHNLFNGAQYSWELLKNARRWVEGGIKFSF